VIILINFFHFYRKYSTHSYLLTLRYLKTLSQINVIITDRGIERKKGAYHEKYLFSEIGSYRIWPG
nr:hypothetical protein [Atribacterota bacterium]